MTSYALVLDVGKTHVKLTVLAPDGREVFERRTRNGPIVVDGCTRLDIEGIWGWFCQRARQIASEYAVDSIAIATHGAAAVLIDKRTLAPVCAPPDYECNAYSEDGYDALRPPFADTFSPRLPAGLNLGRQLHRELAPFSRAERAQFWVMVYPNYWSWRLTGVPSTEITSLGCHTDLWNVRENKFSSLVSDLGLEDSFPPMFEAWKSVGGVSAAAARETGLPEGARVLPGMHDSNAGYFPYLRLENARRPTVISTGTWAIVLCPHASLDILDERLDMLANVDARGGRVATARYMGGREFEEVCALTGSDIATECSSEDLQEVIDGGVFVLPTFAPGAGPYSSRVGEIIGRPRNGKACATLYSALMLDALLTNLRSTEEIVVEGSFAKNEQLCGVLAALRPHQVVTLYPRSGGVVGGCYHALNFNRDLKLLDALSNAPLQLEGLLKYRKEWHERLQK
jgi:sugar (pentulose or hexulose) kinase